MKKKLALLLICALTLTLTACENNENTKYYGMDVSHTSANSEASSVADDTEDSVSYQQSEPDNSQQSELDNDQQSVPDNSQQPESDNGQQPESDNSQQSEPGSVQQSGSVQPETKPPLEDVPEVIQDIHDLSTGNHIYNPSVTDLSNTQRYYGNFTWTDDPKSLWTSSLEERQWESYDADAAVAYGLAHWNDGYGLCAAFISRCLAAGGIINYTESSTSLTLQLLNSRLGFGQFLPYDKSDHSITLPEYARPGDVVQIYCTYEGLTIHSVLMVGTDDDGKLKAVCHNNPNSGQKKYRVDGLSDPCYDCGSKTVEVFFYHFYSDEDEGLPEEVANNKDILLWEESAYAIQDEEYDRKAALAYARKYHKDGFGYYGAVHTSNILKAGHISVSYPNQSALFLQLLKSHLGSASSHSISSDRTVMLPENVKAGDIGFVYCPKDGIMISSFIIAGSDSLGRMRTLSYDLLNNAGRAYKIENNCVGCGSELNEVIFYCFED